MQKIAAMMMFTTHVLPEGVRLLNLYHMVQITQPIEISSKGLVRSMMEKPSNGYQDAIDALAAAAPKEANAIIGIQVATSTQTFSNATFLYLTYIGTPALVEIP